MNAIWTKYLPRFLGQRLENRHNLQKIISNTGWLFADKVLRMGVGLIVGVWVARYLGPEQFGLLSYATAFVALFAATASLGLDGIAVRDIVREPAQTKEILGTVFFLRLAGGLATLVLTVTCISLLRPAETLIRWLILIIAAGTVFQAFDTIDYWFQSHVQSRYTVIAKNAAFLFTALLKIILLIVKAPLIAFASAGLIEIIAGAMGLLIAYKSRGQYLKSWGWSLSWAKRLLRDSWPLIFAVFSINIYMRIDQVMLGEMIGGNAVGLYSAAVKLSEIWYFIPAALVSSAAPAIIQIKTENEALYYLRLQKLFNIMTALSLSIAIPMTFLSTRLVTLLFGSAYSTAGQVLAIHIWAAVFVFLGLAQGPWDVSENLTKFSLLRTASGAVLNIVLNLILIPKFSIVGAAVATVVSQSFSAVILNSISNKTRIIFFKQIQSVLFFRLIKN
jgi:PST family polysaccharide transporter